MKFFVLFLFTSILLAQTLGSVVITTNVSITAAVGTMWCVIFI